MAFTASSCLVVLVTLHLKLVRDFFLLKVIAGMRYFWDLHFTTKDVKKM